jgi:N-acetylmuramoyl-L-alanine amidase
LILTLVCACQLVAASGELLVRSESGEAKSPLSVVQGAHYVGWSTLKSMGARLRMLPNGRASLELSGVHFELTHGVPFTRVGDRVVPLAAAPRVIGDTVAVPLQLIAQVLPRFAAAVKYSTSSRTLTLTVAGPAAMRGSPGTTTQVASAAPIPRRRRIIVDAGHGGPDVGTSIVTRDGVRVTEKSITLAVATMLGEELKRRDFEVVFTRTRDTLIALQDRGRIANASGGTAFVSVHVNAAGSAAARNLVRGVETYFLSVARTEDARRVQAIENSSVQFERSPGDGEQTDPLSFILSDMRQNDHLRESSELAEGIQRSLSRAHPGGDRGVKQAEFAVLVGSFMPSVLVEVGFLSNASDAAFLVKKENQRKIAVAMATGIANYFTGYERRLGANGVGK